MGCCGKTKKSTALADIKRERGCTDIIMLLAFLVSFAILPLIHSEAVKAGADPNKILRGVDMAGRICGTSGSVNNVAYDMTKLPYAAWPHPFYYDYKICVDKCTYTNATTLTAGASNMVYFYPSIQLAYYCIPDVSSALSVAISLNVSGSFSSSVEAAAQAVSDVITVWPYILISCGTAIIVAFIFMPLLRFMGKCIVWSALGCILVGLGGGGYFLYAYGVKSLEDGSLSTDNAEACKITAYVLWGITAIYFLVIFFLRKRIQIAIEVVKDAACAITDMPLLVTFPLFPVIVGAGYICVWLFMATYVWSVSSIAKDTTGIPSEMKEYKIPPGVANGVPTNYPEYWKFTRLTDWQYVAAYLFFHLLWMTQFLFYFAYLAFAGATADWYFTPRDEKGHKKRGKAENELSKWPIVSAVCRTIRYHVGTVATCAFIIAVIQFIRACVLYIEKKVSKDPPNKLQKAIFCLIHCYLKCLECCMDKINKNALVWCAVFGDNFPNSACSSFQLVWANLGRVAALHMVTGILLRITKLAIAAANAGIFAAVFTYYPDLKDKISSIIVPAVIVFLLSYFVATSFMIVFRSVIDTVFLCFLIDCEHNDAGNMMASVALQKLVGKYEADGSKEADEAKARRKRRPGYKEENTDEQQVQLTSN